MGQRLHLAHHFNSLQSAGSGQGTSADSSERHCPPHFVPFNILQAAGYVAAVDRLRSVLKSLAGMQVCCRYACAGTHVHAVTVHWASN